MDTFEQQDAAIALKEELKAQRIRCWNQPCKNRAWLRDWKGWVTCFYHWWTDYRYGGGRRSVKDFIYKMKTTEVFL